MSRPKGYGMTAELNAKADIKRNPEQERQCLEWIEAINGEKLQGNSTHEKLKDGIALCKLMNNIRSASIKKINESKMAFKQMENISNFLTAISGYGVPSSDQFQTVDLYEAQNMPQVICTIEALGRQAQKCGYDGPTLGAKMATENKREFTDEQMKAGQNVVGLQMGSNKGATAAGVNFGKTRHI